MPVVLDDVTWQRSWHPFVARLLSLSSLRGYGLTGRLCFMSGASDWSAVQVVAYDGWEYTVLERELGAHRDPSRKMLVTVSRTPPVLVGL